MDCVIEFSRVNCAIDMNVAVSCTAVAIVLIVLFITSIGYNAIVAWLEKKGYDEGYTAILVVIGVGWTLAGAAILDWKHTLLITACFISSGTPMIIGSWWRHVQKRRKSRDDLAKVTRALEAQLNMQKETPKEGEGYDTGEGLA